MKHLPACICKKCISKSIKQIKDNVNEIENSLKTINNGGYSKQQYIVMLRLIEMKDKYRNLLNFFTHEKITNHISINKN